TPTASPSNSPRPTATTPSDTKRTRPSAWPEPAIVNRSGSAASAAEAFCQRPEPPQRDSHSRSVRRSHAKTRLRLRAARTLLRARLRAGRRGRTAARREERLRRRVGQVGGGESLPAGVGQRACEAVQGG